MKLFPSQFFEHHSLEENYFIITTKNQGLGDQLDQFSMLFRIGNVLGFSFLHVPLVYRHPVHTQNFKENLFEEFNMGNGEILYSRRKTWRLKRRKLNLNKIIEQESIQSVIDLKNYLLSKYGKGNLFNFIFKPVMYSWKSAFKIFELNIENKYNFPFQQKYWLNKKELNEDKILICMHIRRGDINIVKIREGLYFSFHLLILAKKYEVINTQQMLRFAPTIEYLSKIKSILGNLNKPYKIVVLSDGVDIAIKRASLYYRILKKYFSSKKEMLAHFQTQFENEMSTFRQLPNCEFLIGAYDYEITKKSIHYLACSDIMVVPQFSGFSKRICSFVNRKPLEIYRVGMEHQE